MASSRPGRASAAVGIRVLSRLSSMTRLYRLPQSPCPRRDVCRVVAAPQARRHSLRAPSWPRKPACIPAGPAGLASLPAISAGPAGPTSLPAISAGPAGPTSLPAFPAGPAGPTSPPAFPAGPTGPTSPAGPDLGASFTSIRHTTRPNFAEPSVRRPLANPASPGHGYPLPPCSARSAPNPQRDARHDPPRTPNAMLDTLITGGTLIDGTGAPARPTDIGISNGRIVALADPGDLADTQAADTIDAAGLVVCPGFIDPHTHYDAQIFWDPRATPSNLFGVTTVIGGNCGFTLAPLGNAEDGEYLKRMMVKVEGMELARPRTGRALGLGELRRLPAGRGEPGRGRERRLPGGTLRAAPGRDARRRRRPRGQRGPDRPDAGPAGRVAGLGRPRLLHRPQLHPQRLGRPARAQPLGLRTRGAGAVPGDGHPPRHHPGNGWPTAA